MNQKLLSKVLNSIVVFGLLISTSVGQESNNQTSAQSLESLVWLSGEWIGEVDGTITEETWMAPRGGMMLGVNRTSNAKRAVAFENLRIVEKDGEIVYLASPGGREPTSFKLTESGQSRAVFENPEHDFPQRIIYDLGDDQLSVRIEGKMGGKVQAMEMNWQRPGLEVVEKGSDEAILRSLKSVILNVEDLSEAKDWYTSVLGKAPYFDEAFYAGFRVGDNELGLDPDMEGVTNGNSQVGYWQVENCQQAFDSLLNRGAKVVSRPQDVGEGTMVATVLDPFGNTLGIIEIPGK